MWKAPSWMVVGSCLICTMTFAGALSHAAESPDANKSSPAPVDPKSSGGLSTQLGQSGGVIQPPANVDPEIEKTPPDTSGKMLVIPPPGEPGGNPTVKPK